MVGQLQIFMQTSWANHCQWREKVAPSACDSTAGKDNKIGEFYDVFTGPFSARATAAATGLIAGSGRGF